MDESATTPDTCPYPDKCKTQLMKYTKNPSLYYCLADKPLPYSCNHSFTFGTACFCKHPDNAKFTEQTDPT